MKNFRTIAAAAVFALGLQAGAVLAGTLEVTRESDTEIVLAYKGTVDNGDSLRLRGVFAKLPVNRPKILELDLRGGTLYEALEIGRYLNRENVTAVIQPKASCSSPCPLIFVGAPKQIKHSTGNMAVQAFNPPARDDKRYKVEDVNAEIARTQKQVLDVTDYLVAVGANTNILRYYFANPKAGTSLVIKNEMLLDLGLAVHDDETNEVITPRRAN